MAKAATKSSGESQASAGQTPKTQISTLKVQLLANNQIVAQSEDQGLWLDVMAVISGNRESLAHGRQGHGTGGGGTPGGSSGGEARNAGGGRAATPAAEEEEDDDGATPQVRAFATSLGVTAAELVTACSLGDKAPFMHLDHDCWTDMKTNTPVRGRNSISNIAAAGVLLALWNRQRKVANPSTEEVAAVLDTAGIKDDHVHRGLRNSEWLQLKGNEVTLRATMVPGAKEFAKKFCSRQWKGKQ